MVFGRLSLLVCVLASAASAAPLHFEMKRLDVPNGVELLAVAPSGVYAVTYKRELVAIDPTGVARLTKGFALTGNPKSIDVVGDTVIIGSDEQVVALASGDAALRWKRSGMLDRVTIYGNAVYVTGEGIAEWHDAATGKTLPEQPWQRSPARVVISQAQNQLVAMDAANKKLWQKAFAHGPHGARAYVELDHTILVDTEIKGLSTLIGLEPTTGNKLWALPVGTDPLFDAIEGPNVTWIVLYDGPSFSQGNGFMKWLAVDRGGHERGRSAARDARFEQTCNLTDHHAVGGDVLAVAHDVPADGPGQCGKTVIDVYVPRT